MALTRAQKEELVANLELALKTRPIIIFSRYKGLTVVEADVLRKNVRAARGTVKIAKNTLLRLALKHTNLELDPALLDEPLAIVEGVGDQAELSKALKVFNAEHPAFEPVAGVMDGGIVSAAVINELALLPSRAELEAKLVGVIAGPLSGLVNVILGPARGLVNVLQQYKQQREGVA